jgi:hypothetical protein
MPKEKFATHFTPFIPFFTILILKSLRILANCGKNKALLQVKDSHKSYFGVRLS